MKPLERKEKCKRKTHISRHPKVSLASIPFKMPPPPALSCTSSSEAGGPEHSFLNTASFKELSPVSVVTVFSQAKLGEPTVLDTLHTNQRNQVAKCGFCNADCKQ